MAAHPEKTREYRTTWARNHPEGHRRYALKKNYGLTPEKYEEMMEAQGRRCAVCRDEFGTKGMRPHVDHDHVTGKVRGIIHHRCNIALSYVEDAIFRTQALAYLGAS